MNKYLKTTLILLFFVAISYNLAAQNKSINADYHVHLQDSVTVQLNFKMLKAFHIAPTKMDSLVLEADSIIGRLNKAKFQSAWILSNAYLFGSPLVPVPHEYDEVKKQNNWIADQASRYPDRLKPFLSLNPIKPYALKEMQRCIDNKHFAGLKLHFAACKINLFDSRQVKQLQKVFALANRNHLLMLVHLRSGQKWDGRANAQIFLKQLMPFAKDTKVVVAHMAGWGGYDKPMSRALSLFASYIHNGNAESSNLYLDISAVFPLSLNEGYKPVKNKTDWNPITSLKTRIKQIGPDHIVFGTDWPLIDIDPYIELLEKALGKPTVQQILSTQVLPFQTQ